MKGYIYPETHFAQPKSATLFRLALEYGGSGHKQIEKPSDLNSFFLDFFFGCQRLLGFVVVVIEN